MVGWSCDLGNHVGHQTWSLILRKLEIPDLLGLKALKTHEAGEQENEATGQGEFPLEGAVREHLWHHSRLESPDMECWAPHLGARVWQGQGLDCHSVIPLDLGVFQWRDEFPHFAEL
jgi:hypothetical protein